MQGFDADEFAGIRTTADVEAKGGLQKVLDALETDPAEGIDSASVDLRRRVGGSNRLPPKAVKSVFEHFYDTLEDPTVVILIFSAVFTTGYGLFVSKETIDIVQGVAILAAVVIVSGVGTWLNYSRDQEFRSLAELKADRAVEVIRNGSQAPISVHDLVVGDVVVLRTGGKTACDGVLVDGQSLSLDESQMTGEPEPAAKTTDGDLIITSGCLVVDGFGRMVVTAVGVRSEYGKLVASLEQEDPPRTPLEEKLDGLADIIGYVGFAAGLLTFLVLAAFWVTAPAEDMEEGASWWDSLWVRNWMELFDAAVVAVTIVVVAVPEGLPLAVTISLAFSMQQMVADKNLVRSMHACETMGSASVIASDKTGTLTENRMTVQAGDLFSQSFEHLDAEGLELGDRARALLVEGIVKNSLAVVKDAKTSRPRFLGSQTEGAMLFMLLRHLDCDEQAVSDRRGILYSRPFTSARKHMLTVVSGSDGPTLHVKGAAEMVLGMCTREMTEDGEAWELSTARRQALGQRIEQLAASGLRALALASRTLDPASDGQSYAAMAESGELTRDLVLLGVIGIADPVRPEVPGAVQRCREAGIRVIMVTGDHQQTAQHIARECGILTEGGRCLLGAEFRAMNPAERRRAASQLQVLARSSPMDKHDLVQALMRNGDVVGVTGDGTNDAPALRAAHVGLSMGIAGTEVAKDASDIIIMDDNFSSIVKSVLWGRSILTNVRKFLQFQLTINLVALVLTFLAACRTGGDAEKLNDKLPLSPVQMLWLNLVMDSLAALALATEPPTEDLLRHRPEPKRNSLLTSRMWKNMILQGGFQLVLLVWLTLSEGGLAWLRLVTLGEGAVEAELTLGSVKHHTIIFTIFIALQWFNLFHCRKIREELDIFSGVFLSKITVAVLIIIAACQWAMVQFGGEFAQTTPLEQREWLVCLAVGATSLPVGWVIKLLPTPGFLDVLARIGAGSDDEEADEEADEEGKEEPAAEGVDSAEEGSEVDEVAALLPVRDNDEGSRRTVSRRRRRSTNQR